jgi:hypothetical protein
LFKKIILVNKKMETMKKFLTGAVLSSLLIIPLVGLAQITDDSGIQAPGWDEMEICCGSGSLLDNIFNSMFIILLVVAAISIVIAGVFFVTAQGDPDKVAKARQFVLYALIGVLVAFAAKGLILLVVSMAG